MKEPHNYRKVGYSMIVISVSLTLIGLIVWVIGGNYHYSSDLMAGQEIGAMTPKAGYNIVSFDDSQPVGAKIKLLDHASTNETALQLAQKYTPAGTTVLIFKSSLDYNKNLIDKEKSLLAQAAQEKMAAASVAKSNTTAQESSSSKPQTENNTNLGNESKKIPEILNSTINSSSSPTGGELTGSVKESNSTISDLNQTNSSGIKKSVNLSENVTITSK